MEPHHLTPEDLDRYLGRLRAEERSAATLEKYTHDLRKFYLFLPAEKLVDKEAVLAYKQALAGAYRPASVNSMLVALNTLLAYLGWGECRVRLFRLQRQTFSSGERELRKEEYLRLLAAARRGGDERLCLVLQTICATGIRVSELRFITAEAVRGGSARVDCKGKLRVIWLPRQLRALLAAYCRRMGVRSGSVFRTRGGRPLDRSNLWAQMKKLCAAARVAPGKVFPHNLRHLFARTYYRAQKDIVRLADLLGHSSLETTRIYTLSSGAEQQRQIDRLGLVV